MLYFPSGAVYPQQGFPGWMRAIAAVDPFTYAVHAFKSLLLKNTGFEAMPATCSISWCSSAIAMTCRDAVVQEDAVGATSARGRE